MRKFFLLIIVLSLSFAYTAYAQFPKYLYGIVSWYGDEFAGKKTASGEYYDPQAYTAAHRTLPYGTELEIENLDNGHRVKVRVNDRGPLVDNRILDISKKAADELGILQSGTVYAKITLIKVGNGKARELTPRPEQKTESSMSSSSASASSAPASNTNVPVIPEIPAAVEKPVSTNYAVVVVTNSLTLTNQVSVPVSNIVNVPPYEDKIVEKDISNSIIPPVKESDGFIVDEPQEIPPLPPVSENPKPNSVKFKEDEVTPETLLTNEVPVHMEGKNTKGESFIESNIKPVETPAGSGSGYVVQVGAFQKEANALSLYDSLKKKGYNVFTTESPGKKGTWIRVRVGYFETADKAKEALDKLKTMKLKGAVIKVK